jgi:hypothetical protein
MGKDEKALLQLAINRIDEIVEQLSSKIEENNSKLLNEVTNEFKDTNIKLDNLSNTLQTVNQKIIEFETRFKQIDTIQSDTSAIKTLNEEVKQKMLSLDSSIENIINSVKDSTNSVRENIISNSDAEKTRYQSLLTSLEEIPKQLSGSLSSVAGPIVSQSVKEKLDAFSRELVGKIQNLLIKNQQDLQTELTKSVENTIDKQKEILEMIRSEFSSETVSKRGKKSGSLLSGAFNRDLEEVRDVIHYFQKSPKDKKSSIIKIEQARDSLIADRATEAPYRVTASRTIREALSLLSAEHRDVPHHVNTQIIKLFEDLQTHILSTN